MLLALFNSLHSPWVIALGIVLLIPFTFFLAKQQGTSVYAADIVYSIYKKISFLFLLPPAVGALGALYYLSIPQFLDHIEPQVASVSSLLCRGDEAYQSLDAAGRYSLLYGPLLYQLHCGVFRVLGPEIINAKLIGVLSFVCIIIGSGLLGFRLLGTRFAAFAFSSFIATVMIIFSPYVFWNRADPLLILLALAGGFAALIRNGSVAATTVGVLMGVAFNLKGHAFLYLLPLAIYVGFSGRFRLHRLVWGTFGFLVPLTLVIGADPGQYREYVNTVLSASGHAIVPSAYNRSATLFVFISMPLLYMALRHWDHTRTRRLLPLVAFLVAGALIVAVSGKQGAGWHHLLPLIPVSLALTGLMVREITSLSCVRDPAPSDDGCPTGREHNAIIVLLALGTVLALPHTAWKAANMVGHYAARDHFATLTLSLHRIQEKYGQSNLYMGYSDRARYADTFLRPQLVFWGHPYLLDAAAEMDYLQAGIRMPDATLAKVARCVGSYWILPAQGIPFSMTNNYTGEPLYSEEFRSLFADRYMWLEEITGYAVYGCREDGGS